jgi:hypothetical protein
MLSSRVLSVLMAATLVIGEAAAAQTNPKDRPSSTDNTIGALIFSSVIIAGVKLISNALSANWSFPKPAWGSGAKPSQKTRDMLRQLNAQAAQQKNSQSVARNTNRVPQSESQDLSASANSLIKIRERDERAIRNKLNAKRREAKTEMHQRKYNKG